MKDSGDSTYYSYSKIDRVIPSDQRSNRNVDDHRSKNRYNHYQQPFQHRQRPSPMIESIDLYKRKDSVHSSRKRSDIIPYSRHDHHDHHHSSDRKRSRERSYHKSKYFMETKTSSDDAADRDQWPKTNDSEKSHHRKRTSQNHSRHRRDRVSTSAETFSVSTDHFYSFYRLLLDYCQRFSIVVVIKS